ncbi:hypothetical protein M2118_001715 [Aurantimicrobium minutum]|nr:hypothetical protein [Aurantimicrobium minutum]
MIHLAAIKINKYLFIATSSIFCIVICLLLQDLLISSGDQFTHESQSVFLSALAILINFFSALAPISLVVYLLLKDLRSNQDV